jgi:hypothetical protein
MPEQAAVASFEAQEASREFLGQWHRLVSTTNWEKGRIILNWRQALIAADAPALEYSDEAWSRQVGNVSGQHVGRLRRVYERFGGVRNDYPGLYWSHFQAAVDWDDAEMWLEGAVQSKWSVSQMRYQRWEVLGKPAAEEPHEEDLVTAEVDEDSAEPAGPPSEITAGSVGVVRDLGAPAGPDYGQGPDWGDESGSVPAAAGVPFDPDPDHYPGDGEPAVRPFENLPQMPDDLQAAFESFKLAILRHKLAGWVEIPRDDLLHTLDALKQLALAP